MAFQHLKSCLFSCERAFVFLRIELTCILQQSAANEYSCLPLVEADNPAKVLYSQDFFRQREPSALSTSCVSLDTSLLCSAGVQELVIFSFNFDFFNKFGRVASYNCHRRYIFGYHAAGSSMHSASAGVSGSASPQSFSATSCRSSGSSRRAICATRSGSTSPMTHSAMLLGW